MTIMERLAELRPKIIAGTLSEAEKAELESMSIYLVPPEEVEKQRERFDAWRERLCEPATYEEARRILDERPLAPPERRVSPERLRRFNEKLEAARANRQQN